MKHYIDKTTNELFAFEQDYSDVPRKLTLIKAKRPTSAHTYDTKTAKWVDLTPAKNPNEKAYEARLKGYGSIGDQLDMIYKDQLNGTTTFRTHISKVKKANPLV